MEFERAQASLQAAELCLAHGLVDSGLVGLLAAFSVRDMGPGHPGPGERPPDCVRGLFRSDRHLAHPAALSPGERQCLGQGAPAQGAGVVALKGVCHDNEL